jgi:hypothetical protein
LFLLKISLKKGILQLNPTIFLVAKNFFMNLLFIILLPGAQVFGHCNSFDTGLFNVDRYLLTDDSFHEQKYRTVDLCYFPFKSMNF